MKRFISFIIAIILILSIANCSFAISKEDFIGIWFGKNDNFGYTITFGLLDGNRVALISAMDLKGKFIMAYQYYSTLDNETGALYLTRDEREITYKLKLNGDKLELYNMEGMILATFDRLVE